MCYLSFFTISRIFSTMILIQFVVFPTNYINCRWKSSDVYKTKIDRKNSALPTRRIKTKGTPRISKNMIFEIVSEKGLNASSICWSSPFSWAKSEGIESTDKSKNRNFDLFVMYFIVCNLLKLVDDQDRKIRLENKL